MRGARACCNVDVNQFVSAASEANNQERADDSHRKLFWKYRGLYRKRYDRGLRGGISDKNSFCNHRLFYEPLGRE